MDVAYKNPKGYKTARLPIRQPIYLTWLIEVLSRILLSNKKYKVEKIGMEGLKPPYMILSNHMSFIDFELVSRGTYPHRVNNVVNIDGYVGESVKKEIEYAEKHGKEVLYHCNR